MRPDLQFKAGLKFTSTSFAGTGEIKAFREHSNQVDVILTDTQGHSREQKSWNLKEVKRKFQSDEYKEIIESNFNICVI